MMRYLFSALVLASAVLLASCGECDITRCGLPKHYREIGCEPVEYAADDKDKCCPTKYNCDEVAKLDPSKCHFRGKSYEEGGVLDRDVNCREGCVCRQGSFQCAYVECPELVFNPPKPHCVIQNSREKCCSERIVCDEAEVEALPRCFLDGKEYRKGQIMYPEKERCFSCLCNETFDNATAISRNSNCQEVDCAIDLSYLSKIRRGCVPIYFGEPTCCPIATKCPTAADELVPALRSAEAAAAGKAKTLTCKFGDHELLIGDKVSDSNKCVDCECSVPPMVTCVQKRDC